MSMHRDQVVATAGLVFIVVLTLAGWTIGATRPPRKRLSIPLIQIPENLPPDIQNKLHATLLQRHGAHLSRHLSRPPGPKPDWLIGNMHHLPKERLYETFSSWQNIYGDFIYMKVLGRPMVVVSSLDIAKELTVNRANIYSGRPHPVMMEDLMGWNWLLTGLNPGRRHTEGRKLLQGSLNSAMLSKYDFIFDSELGKFLQNIIRVSAPPNRRYSGHPLYLDDPPLSSKDPTKGLNPLDLISHAVSCIVVRIAYGDGVFGQLGESLVALHRDAMKQLNWVGDQFWVVEYLPFLRYLPRYFPGAYFKRIAKDGEEYQARLRKAGFNRAVYHLVRRTIGPCIVAEHLKETSQNEEMTIIRDALGSMFVAGIDTTSYTITNFLAAIVSHPHVQAKIHEELEAFLSKESKNLPSQSDLLRLPYLKAAWKESIRWIPTLPLGVPRSTLDEDIYRQWYVARDTLVFLNVGYMCRDPKIWDNPDTFFPERWLESHNPNASHLPDVYDIVFGFGARTCPGRELTDRIGLFLAAGMLSMCTVGPPDGQPVPTPESFQFTDSLARYPYNLRCWFRPKSTD